MRLPRLTTRRLMVLVAVVALCLGADRLLRRRADFLTRAEVHADRANDFVNGDICLIEKYDTPVMRGRLHAHWATLAKKYRRAARRPWLSVPPDPPPPE